MRTWQWTLTRIVRRIWFRAALMSVGAVALSLLAAVLSPVLEPIVSPSESASMGSSSVNDLLQIIASSMLAVTTFSVTAMVSAYSSATQLATPRATQLMIEDSTSQNALSTFLGAFVFAIVGLVALSAEVYGSGGRLILFGGTVIVIAIVVVTLLRWIAHIAAFGRMSDVIDRVERAAVRAMNNYAADPHMGGLPAVPVPADAMRLCATRIGYVTHVDVKAIDALCGDHRLTVHLAGRPGAFVHPAVPLAHVEGALTDGLRAKLVEAFTVERHRSFDEDPRLGLTALTEIASRALAPATNDPGTAIELMGALLRVFARLCEAGDGTRAAGRGTCGHVHVAAVDFESMLEDAFRPIAREASGEIEVVIRALKTLRALADLLPAEGAAVRRMARDVRDRAAERLDGTDGAALARVWEAAWA